MCAVLPNCVAPGRRRKSPPLGNFIHPRMGDRDVCRSHVHGACESVALSLSLLHGNCRPRLLACVATVREMMATL